MPLKPMPNAEEAAAITTTEEFIDRFSLEIMPYCPTGMALLKRLASTDAALYEWGRERGFVYFDHPAYSESTLGKHVHFCALCNNPC